MRLIPTKFIVFGTLLLAACFGAQAAKGVFGLSIGPDEALINTPTLVTARVEVAADVTNPLIVQSVALYETDASGKPLAVTGRMYDDGSHGDTTPADTIYSTQFVVNDAVPRTRYFRVSAAYQNVRDRYLSPVYTVNTYASLPTAAAEGAIAAVTGLQSAFDSDVAALGLSAARARALLAAQNHPNIGPAIVNLTGRTMSLLYIYRDPATGLTFTVPGIVFLDDPLNLSDGAGRSVPTALPAGAKMPGNDKLLIFGPGYQAPDPQNGIVEHARTRFGGAEYMSFVPNPPVITARENASLELVKQWGNYGTIVMHTHGGLWNLAGTQQVVLVSGTPASWWNQLSYMFDLMARRIAVAGDGRFVFYPSFVTKYVSGMKDTFVYLGACESLQNDSMWDALKAKGAKVGFGWSQTVNRAFNTSTFAALIDPMLPQSNATNPLTALAAFNAVPTKTDPFGGFNATLTMRTASSDWQNFVFVDGGIVNGDFETGDWTGWTHGAALTDGRNYQLVVGAQKHGGSRSGALGRWDTAFTGQNPALEPGGYEWFYQDFVVPSNATKLSFWWFMETYDTAVWDWFDTYLMDTSGNILKTIVSHGGKPGTNYGPYWTPGGWQYVETDVTAYRGQKVRIYFDQRLDGFGDQQRTYFDDIKVQ